MASEEQRKNDPTRKPSPRKPHRFSKGGWKEMLVNFKNSISKDHVSIIAAGVAFYVLLGIIPALAAAISIYGLIADPHDIEEHFSAMEGVMPQEANQILQEQMSRIADEQSPAGWGALIGIVLALWAGSRGTKATMEALNITYKEQETRGFLKLPAVALALTFTLVLLGLLAVAIIVFLPPLIGNLPLPAIAEKALAIGMWPLLLLIGILGITLLYRFGPSRRQPKWKWLTWGSVTATLLWLIASALFSFYVANFGSYNKTYGSLGAIVVLLLWFWVSAFVILVGAELDAALEQQTEKDVLPE
ncbi:MAG: YihY/virulence factor BrkB family protein [Opitutales bacterium]